MRSDAGKAYWLQLREEGLQAHMVQYEGTVTREDGEQVILLVEQGHAAIALEKSRFLIDWRTWNRPPLIAWIRRPWKEPDTICPE